MKLTHLSDAELLSSIQLALGSERTLIAKTIAHLSEIEERRLHLRTAHASLFEFCLRALKMSEGEAFRRITAARLLRRFPVIYELVESGAVHLSALAMLRDHLTDENHAELLDAACGKTKRELQRVLAERFPEPDAPSQIRKLPERKQTGDDAAVGKNIGGPTHDHPDGPAASEANHNVTLNEPEPPPAPTAGEACGTQQRNTAPKDRPRVEPLSPSRYKVQFTASNEFREKLERACDLLSHANPSRDLAMVLDRAIDALLKDLEKSKLKKTDRPRRNPRNSTTDRIPDHVRREVFEPFSSSITSDPAPSVAKVSPAI